MSEFQRIADIPVLGHRRCEGVTVQARRELVPLPVQLFVFELLMLVMSLAGLVALAVVVVAEDVWRGTPRLAAGRRNSGAAR